MSWVVLSDGGTIDPLAADFRAVAEDMADMRAPLTTVITRILNFVREQFATQGAASERFPWVELSAKYGRWKESRGPGLPLLVGLRPTNQVGTRQHPIMGKTYAVSGRMREEATNPSTLKVTAKRAVYQPQSSKLGFHEYGTEKMPARPPVLFSAAEEARWPRAFLDWANAQLEGRDL